MTDTAEPTHTAVVRRTRALTEAIGVLLAYRVNTLTQTLTDRDTDQHDY